VILWFFLVTFLTGLIQNEFFGLEGVLLTVAMTTPSHVMNKPSDTPVGRTNSLKRKKTDDSVSPDTLQAEALSKSIDTCAHCKKRCTNTGNSEAIQCDLCYSWVHASCESITKSHFKLLNETLSVNSDSILYLRKSNKCNVRFKQLLASKTCPCDLPESANFSLKVDELATRSAKLEKDLAETIAILKM